MKLPIMQSSPTSFQFLFLRFKSVECQT